MRLVFEIIIRILQIYVWILIIRAVLSWIRITPRGVWLKAYRFILEITEPFLRIFRRIIPSIRIGDAYLDISFIIAIIVIQIIIFLLRMLMFRAII